MATKGRDPTVSDSELYELLATTEDWAGRPFTSAPELAERVNISRQAVHRRLQDLVEGRPDVRKYKPGRSAIYWVEFDGEKGTNSS